MTWPQSFIWVHSVAAQELGLSCAGATQHVVWPSHGSTSLRGVHRSAASGVQSARHFVLSSVRTGPVKTGKAASVCPQTQWGVAHSAPVAGGSALWDARSLWLCRKTRLKVSVTRRAVLVMSSPTCRKAVVRAKQEFKQNPVLEFCKRKEKKATTTGSSWGPPPVSPGKEGRLPTVSSLPAAKTHVQRTEAHGTR